MVSVSPRVCCCGMAVVCAVLVHLGPVCAAYAIRSHCNVGEYCGHVVHCLVAGCCGACGVVRLYSFVWWGILRSLPPHGGGGWGRCGWWGGIVRWGGIVIKGGYCGADPRLRVGVPLVVCMVAVLNGGSGGCVMSRVRIGAGVLHCPAPLCIVPLSFRLCGVVFVVG